MFTGWHSTNDSQARYSQNPPHRRGPTEPARADPPIKVTTVSLRDRHDDSISPGLSAQAANDIIVTPILTVLPSIHFSVPIRRTSDASIHIDLCFRRTQFLARVQLRNDVESQEPRTKRTSQLRISRCQSSVERFRTNGPPTTDDAISQVTEARSRS